MLGTSACDISPIHKLQKKERARAEGTFRVICEDSSGIPMAHRTMLFASHGTDHELRTITLGRRWEPVHSVEHIECAHCLRQLVADLFQPGVFAGAVADSLAHHAPGMFLLF